MATTDAAVASAPGGTPAASQSKRDRKRQALQDRLTVMSEKFQREQDPTYRDQLQKVQFEINLVQRFDPYAENPLDAADELRKEHKQVLGPMANSDNARSMIDMAGIRFPEFMDDLEDLVEIRDFQLAQSKNEYDRKVQEYKNTHTYKVETAKREHRALSRTLRDRLVNTLTQKKNRLNREKEVLEINDSNALLLNPNQFSLTNPGSPGGAHGKRATRLRKDVDDLTLFPDSKKRKRNLEDDASAPARRGMDPSSTTPLWQSEKARALAKLNGPVYSIDKLFTDKELSMHYNTAAIAAHQYVLRNRANGNASLPDDDSDSGHANGDGGDDDESTPSAAPAMERNVSHATRSTRGGGAAAAASAAAAAQNFLDDKILGLEGIVNFDLPGNLDLIHAQEPPKMPPPVPQQYLKPYPRSADQNFPVSLSQDDIAADLTIMGFFKQYDQTHHRPGAHLDAPTGMRRVLETVATPYHRGKYVGLTAAPRDDPEVISESLGLTSSLRDQPSPPGPSGAASSLAAAAVPMSRQSSGGTAMSRQATGGSGRGKGRRG
ncbi:deacetylase complex subunit [Cordyceps militaris]|uniref:Deacetylase complex subunit n=1 Tax=Cordyceps militaris TaxID=73501 RepID=A0A2H4SLV0_CORMI|nr:deacetylase complex subunit [Cordyceps militaris]